MEYENGTPALCWFNYAGLTAADEMDWNKVEAHPIPKSETELNAVAMIKFDWLDCPDLTQSDMVDWPAIGTEDLSIASFDTGHKPSGKVADYNDSLATAQVSVAGMVDSNATPPSSSNVIQGSSKLVPVNVDANDLASMADTVFEASEPSSNSSSDSSDLEDPPDDFSEDPPEHYLYNHSGTTPVACPDDIEMELPEEDHDPVVDKANMPDSSTLPLSSVGDQQQDPRYWAAHAPLWNPPPRSLSADLGGWV